MNAKTQAACRPSSIPAVRPPGRMVCTAAPRRRAMLETRRSILRKLFLRLHKEGHPFS